MTHTLHRTGAADSLNRDFVVLVMGAQNFNRTGCAPKLQQVFRRMLDFDPVNFGEGKIGNKFTMDKEDILARMEDTSIVHAVFDNAKKLAEALQALKELDVGLSVVVSGVVETTGECCGKAGLHMHTVENSLGIWGNVARMPEDKVLDISTMCGHGMAPFGLIKYLVGEITAGRENPSGAAEKLGRLCLCGIMNPVRAAELFALMAGQDKPG